MSLLQFPAHKVRPSQNHPRLRGPILYHVLKQLQFEYRFWWSRIANAIGSWFVHQAARTCRAIITDPWRPS